MRNLQEIVTNPKKIVDDTSLNGNKEKEITLTIDVTL